MNTANYPTLLIVFNKYTMGGRETYVEEYIKALKQISQIKVLLLCGEYQGRTEVFDKIAQVVPEDKKLSDMGLKNWLDSAEKLLNKQAPSVVWVHHYKLLPALVLADNFSAPLLITLHGSLFGQGRLPAEDKAALQRALSSGAKVSVVSREIHAQILDNFGAKVEISLMPNLINLEEPSESESIPLQNSQGKINVVMLSRRQKQNHLKAGVKLAARLKRCGLNPTLNIYAERYQGQVRPRRGDIKLSHLFGRRWILKNLRLWPMFRSTIVHSAVSNPREVIRSADMVFGMGRVIVEGLAEQKCCVLIGYQNVIGIVNKSRIDEFAHSNFSGRGVRHDTVDSVVSQIQALLRRGSKLDDMKEERLALASNVNIAPAAKQLFEWILNSDSYSHNYLSSQERQQGGENDLLEMLMNSKLVRDN